MAKISSQMEFALRFMSSMSRIEEAMSEECSQGRLRDTAFGVVDQYNSSIYGLS